MKVLSFIIPAYNSEAFLHKCVDSMLVPELLEQLEIIIVNDGSTDGTKRIGEEYVRRYPDTVRLICQENRGHGGALNSGCAAAQGIYLKVIDADDWVLTENLPAFLSILTQCDSDVVLTHHHTIDITTGERKNWKSFPPAFGISYTFAQIMDSWRSFDRSLTFHGIAYRTVFYHRFGEKLLEHCFYEDHEFATYPCCYAESILPLDLFLYEYRIGDVTQSVASVNQLKRLAHTEAVLEQMAAKYRTLTDSPGKRYAAMKLQGLLLSYLTTALLVDPDRKNGRRNARREMERMARLAPESHSLARRKYLVFRLLNRLHVGKETWDRILQSELYNRIRRNHSFD